MVDKAGAWYAREMPMSFMNGHHDHGGHGEPHRPLPLLLRPPRRQSKCVLQSELIHLYLSFSLDACLTRDECKCVLLYSIHNRLHTLLLGLQEFKPACMHPWA
jgi:hypothetical protein